METPKTCLDLADLSNSPVRILVADDEEVMLEVLQRFLGAKGYQVLTARDGREALEVFHSQACDLIITDMRMPHLDGLQLLGAVKEVNPRMPVIFISGYGDAETVVAALKTGAENFLAKPLDLEQLLRVVKQTLFLACIRPRHREVLPHMRQSTYLVAPSRAEHIRELIYQSALSAVAVGFAERDLDNGLKLALAEALTNAMEHGNGWDPDKKVILEAEVSPQEFKVTVTDQGSGFNYRSLGNPTRSEQLLAERGRGVFIMHAVMDEVLYNSQGTQVTLIKRRSAAQPG